MGISISIFRDYRSYKDRFSKRPVLILPRKIKDNRLEIKIICIFICLCSRVAGESCKIKLFCNFKCDFRADSKKFRGPF